MSQKGNNSFKNFIKFKNFKINKKKIFKVQNVQKISIFPAFLCVSEHGKKQSMLISIKTSFFVCVRALSKTINVYICLVIVKPIHVCINIYLNQNQNVYSIVYENLQYIFICLSPPPPENLSSGTNYSNFHLKFNTYTNW